jgi:hypothetical protein
MRLRLLLLALGLFLAKSQKGYTQFDAAPAPASARETMRLVNTGLGVVSFSVPDPSTFILAGAGAAIKCNFFKERKR